MGPGRTVVTILCDGGARYHPKLFNPEFLREGCADAAVAGVTEEVAVTALPLPPSIYTETARPPADAPPLDGNKSVSVAVIGGGFTGLSAALHLASAAWTSPCWRRARAGLGRFRAQWRAGQSRAEGRPRRWSACSAPSSARAWWR